MPRRTNAFQSVVFHLTRQLQPLGAKVEESRFLVDKTNGKKREVDIVVAFRSGPHELLLCVECNSSRRPATVEWVERMHGKHQALNTNKLVLLSQNGFCRPAVATARSYGYEALKVCDAAALDWRSVADVVPHLGIRATILPRIRKILLDIPEPDQDRAKTIVDWAGLEIQEPGRPPTILWKHVEFLLHARRFTDKAKRVVPANKPTMLPVTITLPTGTQVIDRSLGTLSLRSIYVEAEFQRIETSLPVERYAYGENVKVALGRGKIDRFPVTMSVAQEQGGQPQARVHFQLVVENQQLELLDGRFVADP